jgi:hypothetical protein
MINEYFHGCTRMNTDVWVGRKCHGQLDSPELVERVESIVLAKCTPFDRLKVITITQPIRFTKRNL